MISLIASLLINGIIFVTLPLFFRAEGLWWYFVPSVLGCVRVYCQILDGGNKHVAENIISKHPSLFTEDEKEMLRANASRFIHQLRFLTTFVRAECTAAVTYVSIGSSIFGIISAIAGQWGPLIISAILITSVPIFRIGDAFEHLDGNDFPLALRRYFLRKGLNPRKMKDTQLFEMAAEGELLYQGVIRKLKGLLEEQAERRREVASDEGEKIMGFADLNGISKPKAHASHSKHISAIGLFLGFYLLGVLVLEGLPYVIHLIEGHSRGILRILLFLPLLGIKGWIALAVMFGLLGSFYLWWKLRPRYLFLKGIVYFMRVVTVFLSIMTVLQTVLLLFDRSVLDVYLDTVRYNLFHDLGLKSAAALYAYNRVKFYAIRQGLEMVPHTMESVT